MKLFDKISLEYFEGSEDMKKSWLIDNIKPEVINDGRTEMTLVINNADISDPSKDFCKVCYAKAPKEFFYLPTSTSGKYHGGPESIENSIGGNIIHTKEVLAMAPKVLHRYKELIITNFEIEEMLKVSCILHDICKVSKGAIWNNKLHGEDGADLIAGIDFDHPINHFKQIICFAVKNHMYLWRFENVFNQFIMLGDDPPSYELLVGFMLSECDYYATPFGVSSV